MMTKSYKWTNIILGILIGIFASAVYIMTAEPTESWWDCGEYVSTGYKLLVGHPPGAPTFQLLGRIVSLFAAGDVTKVAFCINCLSAVCSGLTIMFLFWTITMFGRKLVAQRGEMTTGPMLAVFGSALVGSLAYTFTDTFWFSAVEGEVYAMSSFFTALVFWCILKWDFEYDNPKTNANPHRWLVLIAYLVGLSIGVHLLNLLTIPAIVLIVYFKLSKKTTVWGVAQAIAVLSFIAAFFFPSPANFAIWLLITAPLTYFCFKKGTFRSWAEWGVLLSVLGSFVLLAFILYGVIPCIVKFAGKFEIFFVNNMGLPFGGGALIFFLLLGGLIFLGLFFGYKKNKRILLGTTYSFLFLLIGYSTFFILTIRSSADPTIDENNPHDAVSLLAYLNREQYGETPFLTGQTFNSYPTGTEDAGEVYARDDKSGKYVVTQKNQKYKFDGEQSQFLTRMWSMEDRYRDGYLEWGYDDIQRRAKAEKGALPEMEDNLKYMHGYQFNYMYFRYFMWNFAGRQNAIQGHGDAVYGNWISGLDFIDKARLGDQPGEDVSAFKNKGTNRYYMLPLLLGLIGLVFYSIRDPKNSFIVFLLFIMTGMAIAFYLNMQAYQPRERDYAFAASFYAFCIWIGFGVYAIYSFFEKIKNEKVQIVAPIAITLLCLFLVPGVLAKENWDDHDRSNRYTALAAGKAYLDSCEPNAILFTYGDNDTFPIWYAQEVEGFRTDVRNCNLSLLSGGWYVDQMLRKAYESDPLPIEMSWAQYHDGCRDAIVVANEGETRDLREFLTEVKSSKYDGQQWLQMRDFSRNFYLPVDKKQVVKTGTVRGEEVNAIVDTMYISIKSTQINRNSLMVLEMIVENNWERPLYFASSATQDIPSLNTYLQCEGLASRLVPVQKGNHANTDIMYENLIHKLDDHTRPDLVKNPDAAKGHTPYEFAWGGINDPRIYNPEENLMLARQISEMHTRLAEDLLFEYNIATQDSTTTKEAVAYKLNRAEEVLDHFNTVLPDNVISHLQCNIYYLGITNDFLDAATMYDQMAEIYSSDNNTTKAKSLAKKAQDIRGIIYKEINEVFNFYNHATNKVRVHEAYKETIQNITQHLLPQLSSYVGTDKIAAGEITNEMYDGALKVYNFIDERMKAYDGCMEDLQKNNVISVSGDNIAYLGTKNPQLVGLVNYITTGELSPKKMNDIFDLRKGLGIDGGYMTAAQMPLMEFLAHNSTDKRCADLHAKFKQVKDKLNTNAKISEQIAQGKAAWESVNGAVQAATPGSSNSQPTTPVATNFSTPSSSTPSGMVNPLMTK